MKELLLRSDELTRRRFAAQAAGAMLGVGLLPEFFVGRSTQGAESVQPAVQRPATADRVIYLYMGGGMSHLDTLDPKSGTVAGPTTTIASSVPGLQVGEFIPKLAKKLHLATVVRSMTSTAGAHEQGCYLTHTSYMQLGTIRHPGLGAWLSSMQGGGNPSLPNYVYVGDDSRHPGAGFLPPAHSPLSLSNPEGGVNNIKLRGQTAQRHTDRLALAAELDREFRTAFPQRNVEAYAKMYDRAVTTMRSADLEAFDLTREPDELRKAYGPGFGQGCLLARRLIERNVRFVEVGLGGWDTHNANWVQIPESAAKMDAGISTLLGDLESRGLLERTLVVLTTEFGRTPDINLNVGRDHYPKAYSSLVAGGGMKAGYVHGGTDAEGREVAEKAVEIPDFNATLATALGLPLDKIVKSPDGRPFTLADKGKPVLELFA